MLYEVITQGVGDRGRHRLRASAIPRHAGPEPPNQEECIMKNDPNKIETAPFDLEKAMAGHPIIQRDGRRIGILEIHHEPDFFPLNMRLVTKKKQRNNFV